jgi:hypothetical protein
LGHYYFRNLYGSEGGTEKMTEFYDATPRQKMVIARLARALGIREPIEEDQMSMGVAGKLIRDMSTTLSIRRSRCKKKSVKGATTLNMTAPPTTSSAWS